MAFLPGLLLAAPDEALLSQPKSLVEVWSRMDEFHAARGVQKASTPRAFTHAAQVPELGLDEFLEKNRNTGLLVLKGDTLVAERYQYGRTAQHRFASASMAKTVLGMLVGIALHEGHIGSLDDRASHYLPELRGHSYGDTPIRHLLTMSSGINHDGARLVANTLRQQTRGGVYSVLEFSRREAPAGERFFYSSADSQVLALVLRVAVGKPLATYLSEKIWQPMGAEANATWIIDKGGYETGYCCLNATLRDYGRFGMLLASGGALDGRQIIPAQWLKAATTAAAPHLRVGAATRNNGYGYHAWLIGGADQFAAFGIHGQAIFVDPASKIVVVHTAVWADPDDRAARGEQFLLWNRILNTLSSS